MIGSPKWVQTLREIIWQFEWSKSKGDNPDQGGGCWRDHLPPPPTWYHWPMNASMLNSSTGTGFGLHNGLDGCTIRFWIISRFSPIASCWAAVRVMGVEEFRSGRRAARTGGRVGSTGAETEAEGSEALEEAEESLERAGDCWTEPEVNALYRT